MKKLFLKNHFPLQITVFMPAWLEQFFESTVFLYFTNVGAGIHFSMGIALILEEHLQSYI